MLLIYFSLSFAIIIYAIKNTNFIVEYYNLFKLKGVKWLDEYNRKNENGFIYNLYDHLIYHKSDYMLVRMITCPVCLSIWMSIICVFFVGWRFLSLSYLTLFFYYILEKLKK